MSGERVNLRAPAVTARMMAAVKHKGSKAELALRRELHRRGLRTGCTRLSCPASLISQRWVETAARGYQSKRLRYTRP